MCITFPAISVVTLNDAKAGSIVRIARSEGPKLALVADHFANNVRSYVWLNPGFTNLASVIFAENWRNDSPALQYDADVCFELGTTESEIDASGYEFQETPGVITVIEGGLFIRAAPFDRFGSFRLVNIKDGSVYPGTLPMRCWTILSWKLWIRHEGRASDLLLTSFSAANKQA